MSLLVPVDLSGSPYESQQFGPASPYAAGYFSQPAMYGTSQAAYWLPFNNWPLYLHFHNGWDLAAAVGTPLLAMQSGHVYSAGWRNNGGGNVIAVQIRPGTIYTFNHCERLLVGAGQSVRRGQPLATVGATGAATGPHCHVSLEINERAADGTIRQINWNPRLFTPGQSLAQDPRVAPLTLPDTSLPAEVDEMAWSHLAVVASRKYRIKKGTAAYKGPGRQYAKHATFSADDVRTSFMFVEYPNDAGLWLAFPEADGRGMFWVPGSGAEAV